MKIVLRIVYYVYGEGPKRGWVPNQAGDSNLAGTPKPAETQAGAAVYNMLQLYKLLKNGFNIKTSFFPNIFKLRKIWA